MTEERQLTIADVGAMAEEFTGEIHPVADLFPMMTDDELNDLAEDIKANGLIHPIVVDASGALIDGRNRLAGCHRAGVPPVFKRLNGHDPVAFILSANVNRRHLSKGQQAMAVARACLLSKHSVRSIAATAGVSASRIAQANTVLDYAPDLADTVLSGATPLNEAYEEARRRKEAAETDEAKFARLQQDHPDLAVMVQEGQLTLAGALAEGAERKRKQEEAERAERDRIALITRRFNSMLNALDPGSVDPDEWAADWLNADPELAEGEADLSAERALRAADTLTRYARLKREKDNGRE